MPLELPALPLASGKRHSESPGSAAAEPGPAPSAVAFPPVVKAKGQEDPEGRDGSQVPQGLGTIVFQVYPWLEVGMG